MDFEEQTEDLTFESALKELQEITASLESGSAPLDKSLELFERGVYLVKFCNTKLDKAEQRVKFLTDNGEEPERVNENG